MARYKITFNKKACIGCGACTSVCPENWELVENDGVFKAKPKRIEISEDQLMSNQEAENVCPVEAMKIEKTKGKSPVVEEEDEFY